MSPLIIPVVGAFFIGVMAYFAFIRPSLRINLPNPDQNDRGVRFKMTA